MPGYDMKDASLGVWCLLLKKKKNQKSSTAWASSLTTALPLKAAGAMGFCVR